MSSDYFENRKRKKIQNQIATLLEKGYQLQRNGKLREYAELMKQVEELELHFVVDFLPMFEIHFLKVKVLDLAF